VNENELLVFIKASVSLVTNKKPLVQLLVRFHITMRLTLE